MIQKELKQEYLIPMIEVIQMQLERCIASDTETPPVEELP